MPRAGFRSICGTWVPSCSRCPGTSGIVSHSGSRHGQIEYQEMLKDVRGFGAKPPAGPDDPSVLELGRKAAGSCTRGLRWHRLFCWQLANRIRFRRLDQLLRGLAKEIQVLERADDPMLYVERKEYLTKMPKVRAGREDALVVLPAAPSFYAISTARKLYQGD
jgi:hypothetical protein